MLFAGIDAGGSKTECVLTDETGRVLGRGFGGAANSLYNGKEASYHAVSDSIDAAFADAGLPRTTLDGAYLGSAAILTGKGASHVEVYRPWIRANTLFCDGDLTSIWFAGARTRAAVVLIAGTGGVAMGFPEDTLERLREDRLNLPKTSGWGPVLGDEGSGYYVSVQAMRMALRMLDGRIPEDAAFTGAVTTAIRGFAADELPEEPGQALLRYSLRADRKQMARLAAVIQRLAAEDQPTASAILDDAARELAMAAAAAARKLGKTPVPVVAGGGMLGEAALMERLRREAAKYPEIGEIIRPEITAAEACAGLAAALCSR